LAKGVVVACYRNRRQEKLIPARDADLWLGFVYSDSRIASTRFFARGGKGGGKTRLLPFDLF
jgi:hypothetical protein